MIYEYTTLDNAHLQERLDLAMMSLKLSLDRHYEPVTIGSVMRMIEDIWRMMLEQERRKGVLEKVEE